MRINHNNRILINKRMNGTKAPCNAVRINSGEEAQGAACHPQGMLLWPKMELVCCPMGRAKKHGVIQGVVYTLLHVDAWSALRMKPEYGDADIEVP